MLFSRKMLDLPVLVLALLREIVELTKSLDQGRPVTLVINKAWNADRAVGYLNAIIVLVH